MKSFYSDSSICFVFQNDRPINIKLKKVVVAIIILTHRLIEIENVSDVTHNLYFDKL